MATKPPRRVAARPDPEAWGEDELLSFAEAAALLWPEGPLTASSLRTAYRAGELEVTMIARKLLTTRRALAEMTESAANIRTQRAGRCRRADGDLRSADRFERALAAGTESRPW